MISRWAASYTATSRLSRIRLEIGPHFWLGTFCTTTCIAGLIHAYLASVAASGSYVDILAGWLLLLGCATTVAFLFRNLRRGPVARLRLVAAIVGLTLFGYNLMPSVAQNARNYQTQLMTLAQAVRAGKPLNWPTSVGPFTIYDGDINDDGVLLDTRDHGSYSDGDYGIQVGRAGLTYNWGAQPLAPNLWLISR